MADDHSQRPYRSNEAPALGVPVRAPGPAAGGDPLAELARLIGQNDPFSDRDGARRPAAPAPDWAAPTNGAGYAQQAVGPDMRAAAAASHPNDYYAAAHGPAIQPPYGGQNYGRQVYGGPPPAAGADIYQTEVPGYSPAHGGGYEHDPHQQNGRPFADEEEDDLYDDVPPKRRRVGIVAIAAMFALAVIGTAGAFGYRALFGTSGSSGPPPVITADTAPSKIVPATNSKDAQSNKLITDRVNDRGQGEKLVSREEQPVEIKNKPAGVMFPQGQDAQSGSAQATLGSGVVGSEPKKIRTIAIHPDGSTTANATPASAPPAASAQARATSTVAPARQTLAAAQTSASAAPPAPVRVVNIPPRAADPEPASAPRQAVARAAPPVQQAAAAPAPSNAPLSLSADTAAPAPARTAARPVRTAAVAAPAQIAPAAASGATGAAGGYAVQVSSQRSEAEAQAAFRSLQGKYPGQLGSRQPLIHRVDLGAKGIYFRAMVGPFGNSNEAGELCSSLKAAGGECIVQRN